MLLGVDLQIPDGASLALLGRNGVGKSTLLKTVIGHIPTAGGQVLLNGDNIGPLAGHSRAKAGLAFVPQGREIFPGMSVAENLRVAAQAIFGRVWRGHVDRTFEEFPALNQQRNAPGESLSGGQQQILAIARALIGLPRVLLLDEPSEGIAPTVLDDIATLLCGIQIQRGLSVLIAEQNLDFAARIADTALVLERGVITKQLSTAEFRQSPALQRSLLAV